MSKGKITSAKIIKAIEDHKKSTMEIVRLFEDKQELCFDYWAGGEFDGIANFGDYYIDLHNIIFDLMSCQPKHKILEYHDHVVEAILSVSGEENKDQKTKWINYQSYCMGARI
jgi:hypothetical protein